MSKKVVNGWANEFYFNQDIELCAWCFEKKVKLHPVFVYGFVFCSSDCAFRHKEFEMQFISRK